MRLKWRRLVTIFTLILSFSWIGFVILQTEPPSPNVNQGYSLANFNASRLAHNQKQGRNAKKMLLLQGVPEFLPHNASSVQSPDVKSDPGITASSGDVISQGLKQRLLPELNLPHLETYLPHLKGHPDYMLPRLKMSKARVKVDFVIGIPHIKRPSSFYVIATLKSLLRSMSKMDMDRSVIVLCITEPWDTSYEAMLVSKLQLEFREELSVGLLEVIAPYAEYYPDLDKIEQTFGDKKNRVKWRSKQNLDYAFLMAYASSRGKYYIQLEDDIEAKQGFVTTMAETVKTEAAGWVLLRFSALGFIGVLFRCQDVPKILEFILMFYDRKPCDWLLDDYITVRMCGHGEDWKSCMKKASFAARHIKPSLFQHQGLRSSLEGHVNKLKDRFYSENGTGVVKNPALKANLTTLVTIPRYELVKVYDGKSHFWSKQPEAGDVIEFIYDPPINITKVLFISGNDKHEEDIFRKTTLEIMLDGPATFVPSVLKGMGAKPSASVKEGKIQGLRVNALGQLASQIANKPFYRVAEFDAKGDLNVEFEEPIQHVRLLRLHILAGSHTWAILNSIVIT